uniref:Uncharacterized protein n=1 Tax=Anguilla anguilla TaxID=7936 RepID=A0A0E9WFC1_ANGAN
MLCTVLCKSLWIREEGNSLSCYTYNNFKRSTSLRYIISASDFFLF